MHVPYRPFKEKDAFCLLVSDHLARIDLHIFEQLCLYCMFPSQLKEIHTNES